MVNKRVPRQLWDYGVSWVSDIISMTHYSVNSVSVGIPLTNVTGKTVDIFKYLYLGFYDKLWFNDNYGLSPSEPGRWLWISHDTVRLMCYPILTHTGKILSISTVQRVTDIELSTEKVKETFVFF